MKRSYDRRLTALLPLYLVAAGLAAGVAQVIVFRELLVSCQGNEVSMGIILAGWLLWGAVGAIAGGHARRLGDMKACLRVAALLAFLPGIALIGGLLITSGYSYLLAIKIPELFPTLAGASNLLTQLLSLEAGQMLSLPQIVMLGFGATLLPAAVAGAQFATACRGYAQLRSHQPNTVGRAYGLDAVGHLLGGTVLAWLALQVIPPFSMAIIVGLLNAGVGFCLLAAIATKRPTWVYGTGTLLVLAMVAAGLIGPQLARQWRWSDEQVLASTRTIYGDITLTKFGGSGVYVYNNGLPTASSPAPPSLTVDIDFALLQHPNPQHLLMVGGGATGGLAAALRHQPDRIDYVELDPAIFSFVAPWLTAEDQAALIDPRVHTIAGDGRLLVKHRSRQQAAKYDAVLVMLPPPVSAQLNRFYTRQWFEQVRQLLQPEGIVAWQLPSSPVYLHGPLRSLNLTVLAAARQVFDSLVYLPGEQMTIVATPGSSYLTQEAAVLLSRARQRGLQSNMLYAWLPDMLRADFTDYVQSQTQLTEQVPVNSDQRPVAYFYHQAWWLEHRHPGWGEKLSRLTEADAWQWWAIAGVLLFLWALTSCTGPGRRTVVPMAVVVAGLCGMAVEMVLLISFQSHYGYVFQQIGFIVGSFMVGLAGGSWWLGRWLQQQPARRSIALRLAGILGGGAALVALMPPLLSWIWQAAQSPAAESVVAYGVYPLLAALLGLWIGAEFPLAAALWAKARHQQAQSATVLYGADLIGAAVGALIGGTLLVPLLGTPQTYWLFAFVAASAAVVVLLRSK